MPIRFDCPSCNERITVDDDSAGKKMRCPECKTLIAIPNSPAKKTQEVGIHADRKLKASNSRKRNDEAEETPETRPAKNKKPAKGGLPLALVGVAALVLVSCLVVGSGGVAWYLYYGWQPENNDLQAELDVKMLNKEKPQQAEVKDPKNKDEKPPDPVIAKPRPDEPQNGDISIRVLRSKNKNPGKLSSDIVWARDGKSFFILQEFGLLLRFNLATGKVEQSTELSFKCGNMVMSGEGILIVASGIGQLYVINPNDLADVKRKISVPGISWISSGVDAHLAWAGTPNSNGPGLAMQAIDLRDGKLLKKHTRYQTWRFAVSPDGKYVINVDNGGMSRFRVFDTDDLVREQRSYQLGGNRANNICFSPDSQFVAMPSGGGNGRGHPDHPPIEGIFIYPIHNLRKPATVYAPGGHQNGIGIDPKSGCIVAHGGENKIIVYSFSADFKLIEHRFNTLPRMSVLDVNVSPWGSDVIIRTAELDIIHVKINKPGPPISKVISVEPEMTTIDNPAPAEVTRGDLNLRQLTFAKNMEGDIRPGIVWARDGKSFFMLQQRGLIQRVNVATGKTEMFVDITESCDSIALSGEGLLVSLPDAGELRVLDENNLRNVRKRISIPKVAKVAAGTTSSIACIGAIGTITGVHAIDLKGGQILGSTTKINSRDFAATPDGKYLFGIHREGMFRFRIDNGKLIEEEVSYPISRGFSRVPCISPDSKYVSLPQPGAGNGTGYPDHPPLKGLTTYVYPVENLKRPITGLVASTAQKSVGIDPKSGCILAMSDAKPVIVYSFAVDSKLGEHDFKSLRGITEEFAVSPFGSEVIVRTDTNHIFHIRINKGGPPIGKVVAPTSP